MLSETEGRYGNSLMGHQNWLTALEEKLVQLRSDLEQQQGNYQNLLDAKIRLEQEIQVYRELLEGESGR